MKTYFYDIESLDNVFTLANFRAQDKVIEMYYLVDDPSLICENFGEAVAERIRKKNRNFKGKVELYDLTQAQSNYRLAQIFGLSDARYVNDPKKKSRFPAEFRITCDTDPDYNNDVHPYLMGYNSYNYDTTMLALYLCDVISDRDGKFVPGITAAAMRVYNDELFSPRFKESMSDRLKYKTVYRTLPGGNKKEFEGPDYRNVPYLVRKNMLMTGRHLDVARLNEKQSKVGLKRILGMLGYQILESDKLRPGQNHIESADQLLDLMAYNVSDVVNLEKLFLHKAYKPNMEVKRQMLIDYPELVYAEAVDENGNGTYKPDIRPQAVRNDRLTIDSSSAQLATKALCPYGHLSDYDTVSFWYPSENKAKEMGIPRINVLDKENEFIHENFKDNPDVLKAWNEIYVYYKWIEGKNFNAGKNYLIDHGIDPDSMIDPESLLAPELKIAKLSDAPKAFTCMFYYGKDGTASDCFVNFSTGGIHGAQYNQKLWEYDCKIYADQMAVHEKKLKNLEKAKEIYPNPCDLKAAKGVTIDGVKYKPSDFLKPKATKTEAYYKDPDSFKAPKMPVLFTESVSERTGSVTYKLAKRYTYTSAAPTNHEDFVSYYPNLLRMMEAFFNPGLGYDRYGEIFDNKTLFGNLMKQAGITEEEKGVYNVKRNGTKLLLNAASGAGDAGFESPIRMNNRIISMRLIGQIFTFHIGLAQAMEGASIISTNTDGLYSVMEATKNNEILELAAKSINVDIEPEPMFLISKDSNNRVEIEIKDFQLGKVTNASGGSLSCRTGPTPTQNLAHPAILDWAVTEYLIMASIGYKGITLETPFNDELGRSILHSARKEFNDDVHTLIMFQNVIASSPGSDKFVFATKDSDGEPIPLQHYNRCFIMKDGTPGTYHMKAAHAKVVTEAMQKKRQKMNERMQQHDPIAAEILTINGVSTESIPVGKEATVVKINGVEEEWDMLIDNSDLHLMEQEDIDRILDNLDYEKYLGLMRDSFMDNWFNLTPEYIQACEEKARQEKEAQKQAKKQGNIPFPETESLSEIETEADTKITISDWELETYGPPDTCNESLDALWEENFDEHIAEKESLEQTLVPTVHAGDDSDTEALTRIAEGKPSITDGLDLPKMIKLNNTLLSPSDIYEGEKKLHWNGIKEDETHRVLRDVMLAVTKTDIG